MVTIAAQISVIDKERRIYAFEPFIDLMYYEVARVSPKKKFILWQTPAEGYVSVFPNTRQMTAAHTGIALLHKQFTQPDVVHQFMATSLACVSNTLQWDSFYKTSVLASTPTIKVISLEFLCRDVIMDAQVTSFFGPRLFDLEPNLRFLLKNWDVESWRVSYKLPSTLSIRTTSLRDYLIDILTQSYNLPAEQRAGCLAFVNEVYDDYKHAGLSDRDIAGIVFTILWGLIYNVTVISYWMTAHLMDNPTVVNQIREEIAPMMPKIDATSTLDGNALAEITKNPLLNGCLVFNSTFNESLRFTATGSSFRKTTRDTTLEGRRIPKDTTVAIPQRVQMMDEEAFGPNSHSFDCYRFLRNKSLLRKVEFRGFGGGATCHVVQRQNSRQTSGVGILGYILWRYDLKVVGPEKEVLCVRGMAFPRLDEAKPSLGPGRTMNGDDQILKMTRRIV